MTDLSQALTDLRSIRRQVAEATEFRGYGPLTLMGTALLAVVVGWVQAEWIPTPETQPSKYIALWLGTGVLAAGAILHQTLRRAYRFHGGLADEMLRLAVAQFLPAASAGVALPFVLLRHSGHLLWMVPGLWQIIFSLGVFASCRCLPRAMLLTGTWFFVTGLISISLGDTRALAPLTMAGSYGLGMAFTAAVHLWSAKQSAREALTNES